MKCPYCNIGVSLEFEEGSGVYESKEHKQPQVGYEVVWDNCPECEGFIVILRRGKIGSRQNKEFATQYLHDYEEEILYPKYSSRSVETEVPDKYKVDFLEACTVLPLSPKASAALSRRILQNILREEFKIKHQSLAKEIDDFIQLKSVPSYLTEAVDAIRNIGNFAAHPLKDTNTGEIVNVEPGEGEWLIEVLEALFDFVFVQPNRLQERKKKLNQKLKSIGKPPMKS